MICVQLRKTVIVDGEFTTSVLLHKLEKLNILKYGSKVIGVHIDNYTLETATNSSLNRLANICDPYIEIVRTTDFADGYFSATNAALF